MSARSAAARASADSAEAFSLARLLALNDPFADLDRLTVHLQRCTLAEVQALLPELSKIRHVDVRKEALAALFARWAKDDPAGALAAARTLEGSRRAHVEAVWEQWGGQDVDAAVAAARADGTWELARERIWAGFAEQQPLLALKRAGEFGKLDAQLVVQALDRLASATPQELIADLPSLPVSVLARGFEGLSELIEHDSAGTVQAVSQMADEGVRVKYLVRAVYLIAKQDMDLARKLIQEYPEGRLREELSLTAAARYESPAAGVRFLRQVTGREIDAVSLQRLFADRAFVPSQFEEVLAELPPGRLRDGFVGDVMAIWALLPKLGEKWLAGQSLASLEPAVLAKATAFVPPEQWAAVLDRLETLSPAQRREAVTNLAGRVERGTPLAEVDPRLQAAVAAREIGAASEDVAPSRSLALFESFPRPIQADVALPLAARLASTPEMAAQVLTKFPPEANDPAAAVVAETIAAEWMKGDARAASAWIGQLPPGAVRDAAVIALVEAVAADDRPSAEQWAATLQDPVTRLRAERLLTR